MKYDFPQITQIFADKGIKKLCTNTHKIYIELPVRRFTQIDAIKCKSSLAAGLHRLNTKNNNNLILSHLVGLAVSAPA
jgi:hypothetical protein